MAAETLRQHKFDQVTALINTADDPRTPPNEAANARRLAERMMERYAFEEEEIRQARAKSGGQVETPEIRQFDVYDAGNAFSWILMSLFRRLAEHTRCRVATTGSRDNDRGGRTRYAYVVGFPTDLAFLDLLYTSTRLVFSSNIEPPYDESDYDGSVARMHLAGITWRDIAYRTGTPWPDGQKLRRAWYRYAEANGMSKEEGHRRSPKLYRESFADGFYEEMWNRLWVARHEAHEQHRRENASEADRFALALRSRETVVEEFLYERFPDLRPKPVVPLTDAERKALEKRLEKERKSTRTYKEPKKDATGMAAGRAAARRVNLSGGTGVPGSGRKEL
jgi:hypothetical protein